MSIVRYPKAKAIIMVEKSTRYSLLAHVRLNEYNDRTNTRERIQGKKPTLEKNPTGAVLSQPVPVNPIHKGDR